MWVPNFTIYGHENSCHKFHSLKLLWSKWLASFYFHASNHLRNITKNKTMWKSSSVKYIQKKSQHQHTNSSTSIWFFITLIFPIYPLICHQKNRAGGITNGSSNVTIGAINHNLCISTFKPLGTCLNGFVEVFLSWVQDPREGHKIGSHCF